MKVWNLLNLTKISKLFILFFAILTSCFRVTDVIEPKVSFSLEERVVKEKQSLFPPLTSSEKENPWAKEYLIADSFLKNLDLYRAITSFKRAKILIKDENEERKQEIAYNILLCYYLGKKYKSVLETFENSSLSRVDQSFPAFKDLLIILHESYLKEDDIKNAKKIETVLKSSFFQDFKKLQLSNALENANLPLLDKIEKETQNKELNSFLNGYYTKKKSISYAQFLNAIIPGTGYLYLGQKRAFLTSLLLNSLFIAASYEFFKRGYIAAGLITTSFEIGWYFGGIYGGGEEAKFYNERIYEQEASKFMQKNKLFPFFMLEHTF